MKAPNREDQLFTTMFADARQTLTPPAGLKETIRAKVMPETQQDQVQPVTPAQTSPKRRAARLRWLSAAAAMVLVGAGVALYFAYIAQHGVPAEQDGGNDGDTAQAVTKSPKSTAVVHGGTVESFGFPRTLSLGELMTAEATRVGAMAPFIYKLRIVGTIEDDAPRHRVSGYEAEVLRVFKGDIATEGQQVVLTYPPPRRDAQGFSSWRSFLDTTFLKLDDLKTGEVAMIIALTPSDPPVDDIGRPVLMHAFRNGIQGTRVGLRNVYAASASAAADPLYGLRLELLAALEDRSAVVRRSAIGALRLWCGDLLRDAGHEPPTELWTDPVTREALLRAAADADWRVRWSAVWAIAEHGGQDEAVIDVLRHALFDSNWMVRQPARFWLGKFGMQDLAGPAGEAQDCPLDEWLSGLHTEVFMDKCDVLLRRLTGHPQGEIRLQAAWLLGEGGYVEAVPSLMTALQDEHVEVRRGAAHSLGVLGKSEAADALAASMDDQDGRVRVMAAWALAKLGDARGVERLTLLLKDSEVRSAVQAAEMLGVLGDEDSAGALLEALGDDRAAVSGAAVMALRPFLKGPQGDVIRGAMRQLEGSSKSPYVREAVAAVLEQDE
ncbi:MAG: HEAT repeat domain-containing protein [Planctomycetes bacterium]|nr:HEAT repeat domain-containing protein [Planctomycetota bacterium]